MAGVNVDNAGIGYLHILPGVTESLNHKSKARNLIRQNYNWKGTHLEHKLHTARNHAVKFMSDGGTFPVADKQDYVSMKVGRKIVGGSIQLTDAEMATYGSSREVAIDAVTSEVEGLMKNILKFENFFFFRDGTGVVATVQTGSTGTTLLVNDARGLWDGATYQIYDTTLATLRGSITVTSTASALTASGFATVTTSSLPAGTVATDKVVWDGALNIAYTGLSALIDDASTTFQNVSTSSYPRFVSMVLDNSGTARDLEPALFRQVMAGVFHKTGDDLPVDGLSCIGTAWQLANLDELYEADLRLMPSDTTSGVATPAFQSSLGKVKMSADSDAEYGKLLLADLSQVYRGVNKSLDWRREKGEIFKRSDTSAVWTATAIEVAEMYIKSRNSSGKIEDLNETKKTAY